MAATFTAFGKFTPKTIVTNDDWAKIVDTNDEWIVSRTGIRERRFANKTVEEMASLAAQDLVKKHNIDVQSIDLIIVATTTGKIKSPYCATTVQGALGIEECMAMDINAACSGFVFATQTANAFLATGSYKKALVIGSERLTEYLDINDRSTNILFGDGAACAILENTDSKGILAVFARTKFAPAEVLALGTSTFEKETPWSKFDTYNGDISMNGQEVYKFAVRAASSAALNVIEKTGWEASDVDWFVLHQANKRILDHVAKTVKVDVEKFFMNLDKYGNTSAASIPLALAEMSEQGKLEKGMKIVICGFGGGLSWGAIALEL